MSAPEKMPDHEIAMKAQLHSIEAEAERVLDDPVFRRSPVMSRLLAYLVAKSIEGKSVKAFELAADGLGRTDLSPDTDTYARVAVARLRKVLSEYYAKGDHQVQLIVDKGTYAIRLEHEVSREPSSSVRSDQTNPVDWQSPKTGTSSWKLKLAAIAVSLLALISAWLLPFPEGPRPGRQNPWKHSNFPAVAVTGGPGEAADDGNVCRQKLILALSGYAGIRLYADMNLLPDYLVRMETSGNGKARSSMVALVHRATNRVVWTFPFSASTDCPSENEIGEASFALARIGGAIESFARRQEVPADSPYGCWLRFTKAVNSFNSMGDAALAACARDWYANVPEHPVAAMLQGWTLADKGALAITSGGRSSNLSQATEVLKDASALNADAAYLDIALMRTYSLAGNGSLAIRHANDANSKAAGNRLVLGMAASGLALWNDPRGAEILLEMDSQSVERPPWELVGLFVSAMMREDLRDAGRQIRQLEDYEHSQPLLLLLKAAYAQRTGRSHEAKEVLDRLGANPRILIVGKQRLIDRLPMAPEVKRKLNVWLAWNKTG